MMYTKLNPYRVSDHTDAMMNAYVSRMHGNLRGAARWLDTAAEIRREAWKPWDYERLVWVCGCCMLTLANGECCADDTHNGDYIEPLSLMLPEDSWAMGGYHSDNCTPEDRDEGCGCDTREFETRSCRGCGSQLHGSRYAVTVFVNDRRNVVAA